MVKDGLKITGRFRLWVYENGILKQKYEDNNLVVKSGKTPILTMLGSGTPGFFVQKISFGNNATAPADGDAAPLAANYDKPLNGFTLSYPSIDFSFSLSTSENNGVTINEFGLLLNTGALFARKTGISVNKTPSVSMVGDWSISLT